MDSDLDNVRYSQNIRENIERPAKRGLMVRSPVGVSLRDRILHILLSTDLFKSCRLDLRTFRLFHYSSSCK